MRNEIRKIATLLLVTVLCTSLCTGFAAEARELSEEPVIQTEETEIASGTEEIEINSGTEETEINSGIEETDNSQTESDQVQEPVLQAVEQQSQDAGVDTTELSNPKIEENSNMKAGQKVTWDCVWFGSYPQSEVTSADSEYSILKNATDWSTYEITKNGNRYRRKRRGEVTRWRSETGYYSWSDTSTYHYFKYEPIKWRVLKVDGNQALLLSDIVLDNQKYYDGKAGTSATWEISRIRSWLNGYADYNGEDFIGSAFTSEEQSAIVQTSVSNSDIAEDGTSGGDDTQDRIFLLSQSEVYEDSAISGFAPGIYTYDEARRCKSSTYAKAMGGFSSTREEYSGNCYWWLRSPGQDMTYADYVEVGGDFLPRGEIVTADNKGVRVALNLDLSSTEWSYAGTVCSDGTVEEVESNFTGVGDDTSDKGEGGGSTGIGDDTSDNKEDTGSTEGGNNTSDKKEETGSQAGNQAGSQTGNQSTGSNKGNPAKVTNTDIKVSQITLSGISKKIAAGKKISLTATVTPANATDKAVLWESSNKKIATVNSKGIVTLKKNSGGKKVTITATAKDGSKKKATYVITSMKGVVKKVAISGKKTTTLKAGKTLKLKAKVTASNSKQANKTLKWTSSNTKYATVSSAGKVKTKKTGKGKTVTITATAMDGSGKKAAVKIKLK